ncbi:MAG TPA: orotidine-5'-phosphate decarboxylase [Phycisphaerae bacterium]|nr:orotidine-5'-phosphate decarboxylase [Phycisphaerae bacterium]
MVNDVEKQPPEHFADRLLAAIEEKGSPVCVGLDPDIDRLPKELQPQSNDPEQHLKAVGLFCAQVLEIVAPFVPAVKPQIAYFEQLRGPQPFFGLAIYSMVIRLAREMGLIVIGDTKRGDVGSTARAYAAAHISSPEAADAITVNGYFGADGLAPFVEAGRDSGRGLFVLVRTSNPSAEDIQDFTDVTGRRFYEHIAGQVAEIGGGEGLIGSSGYSCVGAVVGATYPQEARTLREIMPQQIFLVPGYGAQGATGRDCAAAFKPDGTGAIVNASRSVIYAHNRYPNMDWKKAVEKAAKDFAADIASAVY